VDKLHSSLINDYVYRIEGDQCLYTGNGLEAIPKESSLRFEVEIHGNVVVARMYDGDVELGIGHGHVIHANALGIMQAGSYAMKQCYISMGGMLNSNPKGGHKYGQR
jgi:hypothetical protein